MDFLTPIRKKTTKPCSPWTEAEEIALLDHVIDNDLANSLKGKRVWESFHGCRTGRRSVDACRQHFTKIIDGDIQVTASVKRKLFDIQQVMPDEEIELNDGSKKKKLKSGHKCSLGNAYAERFKEIVQNEDDGNISEISNADVDNDKNDHNFDSSNEFNTQNSGFKNLELQNLSNVNNASTELVVLETKKHQLDFPGANFQLSDRNQKKLVMYYDKVAAYSKKFKTEHIENLNIVIKVQYTFFGGTSRDANVRKMLIEMTTSSAKGIKAVAKQMTYFMVKCCFESIKEASNNSIGHLEHSTCLISQPKYQTITSYVNIFVLSYTYNIQEMNEKKKFLSFLNAISEVIVPKNGAFETKKYVLLYVNHVDEDNSVNCSVLYMTQLGMHETKNVKIITTESLTKFFQKGDVLGLEDFQSNFCLKKQYIVLLNNAWNIKNIYVVRKDLPDNSELSSIGNVDVQTNKNNKFLKICHTIETGCCKILIRLIKSPTPALIPIKLFEEAQKSNTFKIFLVFESNSQGVLSFEPSNDLCFISSDNIFISPKSTNQVYLEIKVRCETALELLLQEKDVASSFCLRFKIEKAKR